MAEAFEIIDLKSQDGERIVYVARQLATGEEVELQRFIGKAGLMAGQRARFEKAAAHFQSIRYPHLRKLIAAGVDEVDGMPWAVLETVPGIPLNHMGALSEMDVRLLAAQAMAVLDVTREDGKQSINLDPTKILFARGESGLAFFTFQPRPFDPLRELEKRDLVQEVGRLVQEAAGWERQKIADESFGGLGRWTRNALAGEWDEQVAREELQAMIAGVGPAAVAPVNQMEMLRPNLVLQTGRPRDAKPRVPRKIAPVKSSSGKGLMVVTILLLVGIFAGGAVIFFRDQHAKKMNAEMVENVVEQEEKVVSQKTVETPVETEFKEETGIEVEREVVIQKESVLVEEREETFLTQLSEEDLEVVSLFKEHVYVERGAVTVLHALGERAHQDGLTWKAVIITGRVQSVGRKKKYRYLNFGPRSQKGLPYIRANVEGYPDFEAQLKALEGRHVAVIGKAERTRSKTSPRYFLQLTDMEDLRVVR